MGVSAAPSSRRRARGGFTLLELALVLVIVGVLAVFALPRLTSAPGVTLSATAANLAGSIRYAQSLSMSRGKRYRVSFTPNSYQVTDAGGGAVAPPVVVSPATLSGYNPPLTGSYVAFDTRGMPYVSPTAPLAGTATIVVTSGSDAVNVVVAPETGSVR